MFCPKCGKSMEYRLFVSSEEPAEWTYSCEECGIMYLENEYGERYYTEEITVNGQKISNLIEYPYKKSLAEKLREELEKEE